ncbi:hypothetical protein BDF19DRAFT_145798 [Syncephalis fuscata]|nr:hypothetical protein BDF19DRAFT_145798 [Syncephalis fuscata]
MQDFLICLEMVPAAIGHWNAFSYRDYIASDLAGRMPMFYALRDAFGYKDVWQDTITTVSGTEFNYRTFEPADGVAASWQKRINTGLRYSHGGRGKYWIVNEYDDSMQGHHRAESSQHTSSAMPTSQDWEDPEASGMLGFQEATWDVEAEQTYAEARDMIYGDVNYPVLTIRPSRRLMSAESGGRYGINTNAPSRTMPPRSKSKGKQQQKRRKPPLSTIPSDESVPLIIDDSYV